MGFNRKSDTNRTECIKIIKSERSFKILVYRFYSPINLLDIEL